MKRLLSLLSILFILGTHQASATHIVGGELIYTHIGGNQYAVTLIVFRDCLSGTAAFDNPASVGIFNANGTLNQNLDFTLDSVVSLQSTINSSCVTAPSNVCTEVGYYTRIVTLPPAIGGYTMAYQRCCRNAVIQNIQNPGDVGATYTATIPGSGLAQNNTNPHWNNLPPLYVCANLPFQFNHSAFDLNGDSLVYSLCTPYAGATAGAPQPDPPGAPPYTPILWQAPYGLNNMLGGTDPLTIDPITGQLNGTPTTAGTFLIGLCVQEYRNGVLIGETRRGIQISVVNCQAPVAIPDDVNEISPSSFVNCTELVQFNAFNSTGFSIWWDFGDLTTTSDQSTLQSPTWTYPGPGTYNLTLVVFNPINPNDPLCTDTVVQAIVVQDTVIPDAGPDLQTCPGIPVQIGTTAVLGWTYQWSPTTGLNNPNFAQPTATITGPITYTVTATDPVGCSGTDAVNIALLANSNADAGPDVQICPGDSVQVNATGGESYVWLPNTSISDNTVANPFLFPSTTTDYVVQVTSSDGCVGYDTLNVFVNTPSIQTSGNEVICAGDTVQISTSGANSYTWTPNQNISNTSIASPLVWPSTTTTYLVTGVDANNCEAIDSVVVAVIPLPDANAGADVSVCEGACIGLLASGGLTYTWSPPAGLSNPNVPNPTACPSVNTDYVVTVGIFIQGVGCSSADTVEVSINSLPIADAGPDGIVCNGVGVQLSASGGVTYFWAPTTGLSNPSIANPVALPTVPTNYVVSVTDANQCSDTDTVFVDIFQVIATGDTTVCIGDAAQLGAIGGVSWTWSPSTGLSNVNAQFPTADPTVTTTYTVTADDGTGCLATDDVTVVVSPLPVAFAGFDQGVCAGNFAQLNASGGVSYVWTPASGLSNSNISNPVVTFSSDTVTYSVVVTDAIGCSSSDTVTVWQEPLPVAVAGPDTTICFGQSAQLFAGGGQTYIWSPAAGLNNTTIPNPIATPLTTTTYTVTVGQQSGNLVYNGDFTQGNNGFGSDYTYATQLNPEGLYSIVTNANSVHNAFQGIGHTGNVPNDNFMVVNGAGTPNQNVWCQTVSVSPNTDYYFGAWVSTVVASSPAILQFSINGQVLGSPFSAPFNINNWVQFFQTWNSGTSTTATICVVNQNTNTGGNDFGLDDISFSTFCTNTADVTVTVNPIPVADAGPDQEMCIGDVATLSGSGGTTYQWVPPIGLSSPLSQTTNANPNVTTTYTLIVNDNIGCTDTDEMVLTVHALPIASAGPDQELCIGESVTLQGSGGVGYVWSPATYLSNPNMQLPISTPDQTITYTVTVTDNNSCVNTDAVTVTVNPLPIIDAGLDSMICANSSIILNATGGTSYQWSPLTGLSDPQSANPEAFPLDPITYYVTGTDANGCVSIDSVSITIFTVIAGPDSVICLNDSVQAFVSGGASYDWSPALGVSDPTSGSPFLSPEESTSYTVTVTSQFGCLASASVQIDILTLPISAFSAEFTPSCETIFAEFENNSENSQTFYWSFGDGNSSTEFEPDHSYAPGVGSVVTLIAYNNEGLCVDSVVIDYSGQWFGNDSIDIAYSNVFTPNFDGINDCFRPGFDGRFSECYELKVFNRWGALIFESTGGQNHCWDGHTKGGKRCDEGTYYYITSLKGYEQHGYVTLIY